MKSLILFFASALASNAIGENFLGAMEKEPGVTKLPSGLMYRVLREGDGDAHPLASTSCECHYEGRTAQEYSKEPKGKKFDSSYDRGDPTSFSPDGVIKGWTEAMQLMVQGDKWELFIPSELGYGDSGQGSDIGGGDVLVFTMELLKINGPTKPAERGPPPFATLSADEGGYAKWLASEAAGPRVLAVLRQPIASSKVFLGFKAAARQAAKARGKGAADDQPFAYALTAASKFEKGKYTVDPIAEQLKLSAPAVYVSADKATWTKCKTGRPTEVSADQIMEAIAGCVAAAGGKAEL